MILSIAAAAVLLGNPLRADDKKDEKPKDRAERLREIRTEIQLKMRDVVPEWRSAKTPEDQKKALAKLDPILDKAYALVDESPKDDVACETLLFLLGSKPEPPEKAMNLLTEHHINNEQLAQQLPRIAGDNSAAAKKLMKAAMETSTNKTVKGMALYAHASALHDEAEGNKDEKKSSDLNAQAEKVLESVSKEFGDVHVGTESLKKQADRTLFEIRNLSIGKSAPEVTSRDLDEKPTKLAELKGKVVVLDIWATWCGPCRAMIPHEREMVEKLKDKPFALVSVSADDKLETLKEFLEKEKMPWTHWWEGRREGGILHDWNVKSFPTIYVLDAKGVIRHKGLRGKQLEDAVEKLLEEMAKK
jgi:thiol-disulfide isomerase/thioredoxin